MSDPSRGEPLLAVSDLAVEYPSLQADGFWKRAPLVRVVEGVSFQLERGKTLALVGESGSGKTTTGRAVLRRVPAASGRIVFDGVDITTASGRPLRELRKRMQMVFQDPYGSLNPKMRVSEIVSEPFIVHGSGLDRDEMRDRAAALLEHVGLPHAALDKHPHNFSGGQRQRIGIARALALNPDLIVADEPVAALDVSTRSQVINLFSDLQDEFGLAYLLISHDMAVVQHIADDVAVMSGGRLVEQGTVDQVFGDPQHSYTKTLLAAVPRLIPRRRESET